MTSHRPDILSIPFISFNNSIPIPSYLEGVQANRRWDAVQTSFDAAVQLAQISPSQTE